MIVSLRQIHAFLAVAERRSFTRAAEELHLSQPALSARVRELESDLGLKLFSRTTRSVELTTYGERLLVRAQRALEELDTAILELRDYATLQRGRVSIACVPAVAAHLVPQAIGRFAALYPAVKIEFTELTSAEVEAEVLAGNADFGIGGRTARQGELDLELIARDPFIALVPHDHPLAGRKSVPLSILRNYPLIVMRRGSNVRSTLETAFETKGFKLEPTYETTHHYSVVGMVEAGLGVGALPLMTIASLRCDGLAQVRIIKPSIEREIGIVTKHSVALSPAASELIRFVREEIRNADER